MLSSGLDLYLQPYFSRLYIVPAIERDNASTRAAEKILDSLSPKMPEMLYKIGQTCKAYCNQSPFHIQPSVPWQAF